MDNRWYVLLSVYAKANVASKMLEASRFRTFSKAPMTSSSELDPARM